MTYTSSQDLHVAIETSLTDYAGDFDLTEIVSAYIQRWGRVSIDSIDSEEYWSFIENYAV